MATVKKGMLTQSGEWWKHLRWTKRPFWKGERRAATADAHQRIRDETKHAGERDAYTSTPRR